MNNKIVQATTYVRMMKGQACSRLIVAEDRLYVVKFLQNPQYGRVLVNEWLAARLAQRILLPVPDVAIVAVSEEFLMSCLGLHQDGCKDMKSFKAGIHFGSAFLGGAMPGITLDYIPTALYGQVKNISIFAGALAFDKWTCNSDARQCVFVRRARGSSYHAYMIDNGCCFDNQKWLMKDAPRKGFHGNPVVYKNITGRSSFEPWLGNIESVTLEELWVDALSVPPEWYESNRQDLEMLVTTLYMRKRRVWDLLLQARNSAATHFPLWS